MSARYEGGLGTREGGDLVRWSLDITDNGISELRVVGARSPMLVETRVPEATLTLHKVSREESIAVISLLNEMRSGAAPAAASTPTEIGNRFSGLELE